jgi:hypothetical protein
MLGGIKEFNANDPITFPQIQNDVLGDPLVDDLLFPIIQPKVQQIFLRIIQNLHSQPSHFP